MPGRHQATAQALNDGLVQDCSISTANALGILRSASSLVTHTASSWIQIVDTDIVYNRGWSCIHHLGWHRRKPQRSVSLALCYGNRLWIPLTKGRFCGEPSMYMTLPYFSMRYCDKDMNSTKWGEESNASSTIMITYRYPHPTMEKTVIVCQRTRHSYFFVKQTFIN